MKILPSILIFWESNKENPHTIEVPYQNEVIVMKTWDWRAILISILLSITFWVFHALNAEHTANIKLPIQMSVAGADSLPIVEVVPPPAYLNVNVTGYGWTVLRKTFGMGLEALEVEVKNPLTENYIATKTFRSAIDELLQEMKSINYLLEDSIFFDYDTTTIKEIAVILPADTIDLEEGYRIISDIIVVPSTLQLTGPASELATYPDSVWVGLEDDQISSSYEEELDLPLPKNPLVRADYNQLNVMFDVGFFINQRMQVPVSVINFPEKKPYEIVPSEATLDFFILETEEITPDDYLLILLDYEDYQKADSTILPKVYLPDKMKDVITTPERFKIRFK